MTSIRQQLHEIASQDATVLGLVDNDATRLRGHPVSTPDTDIAPLPDAPWGAFKLDARVAAGIITSFTSVNATIRGGEFAWWIYDEKQAGYGRLDDLAAALIFAYADFFNTPDALTFHRARLFDGDTGESVFGVQVGLVSNELADPLTDQRILRIRWTYRTRYARLTA